MASILLAEDDSSLRSFLCMALERAGHKVATAADGIEALNLLNGPGDYELLLADIVMPGMDGIELSRLATKLKPGLKVMFITGFAAVALGHNDPAIKKTRVLSKPFHLNDIVEQVNTLLAA